MKLNKLYQSNHCNIQVLVIGKILGRHDGVYSWEPQHKPIEDTLWHRHFSNGNWIFEYNKSENLLYFFERNSNLYFILVPKDIIEKVWKNSDFVYQVCSAFPYQIMKTVRLGLDLTEQILDHPEVCNIMSTIVGVGLLFKNRHLWRSR